MRILVIGATGTIRRAVLAALGGRHEIIPASRQKAREKVDIADLASLRALLERVGRVDAIVSAAVSLVNAGLEGFTRAAALEAPRGIRVNVVSPPWVAETLKAMGQDPSHGLPAADVARAYVQSVEGKERGQVMSPRVA